MAILDIMRCEGFRLLEKWGKRLPCVVLISDALNKRAFEHACHAAMYLFKGEMAQLSFFVKRVVWEGDLKTPISGPAQIS